MNINELEIGTKIYFRGDMANMEGFGEITELKKDKWGSFFSVELIDGRIFKSISLSMLPDIDTGDGRTRFCTFEAYEARRKKQIATPTNFSKFGAPL